MSQNSEKIILVIDDEIDLQQLMKIALKAKGYTVETANNGLEGLEKLKIFKPHLIILDLNMPKMGGLEFYQRICDSQNQPKYPVFVLSARANMTKLFKEFNIDGFMSKPFEVTELLNEIDAIVNKKYGIIKKIKLMTGEERAARICIAENNPETLKNISGEFLRIGYKVNVVSSGTEAIETIYVNQPDVALINLNLDDISGDMVILQLRRMVKTRHIKFALYSEKGAEKTIILDKISKKEGVDCFIQYSNLLELSNAINQLLNI
jgi:DNA-binding response OmpR family regulator